MPRRGWRNTTRMRDGVRRNVKVKARADGSELVRIRGYANRPDRSAPNRRTGR